MELMDTLGKGYYVYSRLFSNYAFEHVLILCRVGVGIQSNIGTNDVSNHH